MEIARERFLDDTRLYHLTMALRSRTPEMHSVLSALSDEDQAQVAAALATALDEVSRIFEPYLAASSASPRS